MGAAMDIAPPVTERGNIILVEGQSILTVYDSPVRDFVRIDPNTGEPIPDTNDFYQFGTITLTLEPALLDPDHDPRFKAPIPGVDYEPFTQVIHFDTRSLSSLTQKFIVPIITI